MRHALSWKSKRPPDRWFSAEGVSRTFRHETVIVLPIILQDNLRKWDQSRLPLHHVASTSLPSCRREGKNIAYFTIHMFIAALLMWHLQLSVCMLCATHALSGSRRRCNFRSGKVIKGSILCVTVGIKHENHLKAGSGMLFDRCRR